MKLFSKFDAEKFLKSTIADSMLMDANQFLWRTHYLLRVTDFADRNWFSKIYVDLLMSIESDLKCLIICLSKNEESPEEAYKIARSSGHNIQKLYSEVELRSKRRLKLLSPKQKQNLISNFSLLSVNNRYDLVTFYGVRNDINALNFRENSVRELLRENSLLKLEELALEIHYISKKAKQKLPILGMTGYNVEKYHNRLDTFMKNIGKL